MHEYARSINKFWKTNLTKNGRPRLNMRDQKPPKLPLDLTVNMHVKHDFISKLIGFFVFQGKILKESGQKNTTTIELAAIQALLNEGEHNPFIQKLSEQMCDYVST